MTGSERMFHNHVIVTKNNHDILPQHWFAESFRSISSLADYNEDSKYNDNALKIEIEMLWKKVKTLNTKIEELNVHILYT